MQFQVARFFPEAKISEINDKINAAYSEIVSSKKLPDFVDNVSYLALLVSLIPHNQREKATAALLKLSQEEGFDNCFPLMRSFIAKLPKEQRLQAILPLDSLIKNCRI